MRECALGAARPEQQLIRADRGAAGCDAIRRSKQVPSHQRCAALRLRVAAEWREADLVAVRDLVSEGRLSLDGLITHRDAACAAERAYRQAFTDPACLKMVLDWREAT